MKTPDTMVRISKGDGGYILLHPMRIESYEYLPGSGEVAITMWSGRIHKAKESIKEIRERVSEVMQHMSRVMELAQRGTPMMPM